MQRGGVARKPRKAFGAIARCGMRSALSCLRSITEQEQRAADFHPVAALERVASADRLAIDEDLSTTGRANEEVLALVPEYRLMTDTWLVAEKADVALFGAPDDGDVFDQRVLAS